MTDTEAANIELVRRFWDALRARDFMTRSISRRPSARLIDSRLSRCSLPRARPISTFARPSLK